MKKPFTVRLQENQLSANNEIFKKELLIPRDMNNSRVWMGGGLGRSTQGAQINEIKISVIAKVKTKVAEGIH